MQHSDFKPPVATVEAVWKSYIWLVKSCVGKKGISHKIPSNETNKQDCKQDDEQTIELL